MTRAGIHFATLISGNSFKDFREKGVRLKNADPVDSEVKFKQLINRYSASGRNKSNINSDGKNNENLRKRKAFGDGKIDIPKKRRKDRKHNPEEESETRHGRINDDFENKRKVDKEMGSKFLFSLADDNSSTDSDSDETDESSSENGEEFPFLTYLQKYKPSLSHDVHLLHPTWYDKLYREMEEIYIRDQYLLKQKKEYFAQKKRNARRRKLENKRRRKLEAETRIEVSNESNNASENEITTATNDDNERNKDE